MDSTTLRFQEHRLSAIPDYFSGVGASNRILSFLRAASMSILTWSFAFVSLFGILLIVFSIGFLHDRLALEDFRHAISGASPSEMENGAATFSSLLSHIIGGCVAAGFLCGISGKLKRIVDGCDP